MKKKNSLSGVLFLLFVGLSGFFISCKEDQTTKINPVLFTKENAIRIFFEQENIFECFFSENNTDITKNIDTCILINDTSEFKNHILCSFDSMPNIDFETKTLIIVRYRMPQMWYTVVEQYIMETKTSLELNLKVQRSEGSYEVVYNAYHWGIFPKLPNKNIKINIIKLNP